MLFIIGGVIMAASLSLNGTVFGDVAQNNTLIFINTTSASDCKPLFNHNNSLSLKDQDTNMTSLLNIDNAMNYTNTCPFLKIIATGSCDRKIIDNAKGESCTGEDSKEDMLNSKNFDKDGHIIADTKFKRQYSWDLIDPLNNNSKFRINLDFDEHIQTKNKKINSPRLELIRLDSAGKPNMSTAKNQEIIWTGNIKDYFKEPRGKYQNETYISLQFSTGRHNGDAPDEEGKGFGILFDVSNSSNPNLLEYRENGRYSKFDYSLLQQYAKDDFVFHNMDRNGSPRFINDLLNKDDVELKIKTFIANNNKRVIETFVDDGSGKLLQYWTLNDVTKLKDFEHIKDKTGFVETTQQGSGYVIARSDNIDTRPTSFKSLVIAS
jgi:hypothetical protein